MSSVDRSELRRELSNVFGDILDEKLIEECLKICQMYNMRGEDVFYKWEAMAFGASGPRQFTMDSVIALKAQIQQEIARTNLKKQMAKANLTGPLSRGFGGGGLSRPGARIDPSLGVRMPAKPVARAQDGFASIINDERKVPVAGPSKVKFTGPSTDEAARKKRTYRYMYEKVSERSEVLDDRIDDFAELVKEYYKIDEFGDPSAATEEDVYVVGRIAFDTEMNSSSPAKLNEASLNLETSRMMGSGVRVPLRFDPAVKVRRNTKGSGGIGLFPGGIVALHGKNGGGGWFLVTEILCLPSLKPEPHNEASPDGSDSFSMYSACGPFTTDADLSYKPWRAFFAKIKSEKPAVVLLTGPFIDSAHPCIKNGDVDATPLDICRSIFADNLREFLDTSPGSIILIVPSIRDILSDHAVYPQPEFLPELFTDPRIHLLPNPCRFSLNGVSFAVSSVDVLFHLRKEEFFKRAEEIESYSIGGDDTRAGTDSMANVCRHLLQQRSFYPLFPVPLELSHEVNLDVTHSDMLDLCPDSIGKDYSPDILLVPSRFKQFSKVVDHTIIVNPSFATKGSYAHIHFKGHASGVTMKEKLNVEVTRLEG